MNNEERGKPKGHTGNSRPYTELTRLTKAASSLLADVRSRKTDSGYPHEECTAMRSFGSNTRLSPTFDRT